MRKLISRYPAARLLANAPLADGNEVARFWAELKKRCHITELIASHAERYGLGIGMLR
jgi:hypothetical protein